MDKIDLASARQALISFEIHDASHSLASLLRHHLVEDLDLTAKRIPESTEITSGGPCKILLPRRSGESRFGPPQYYYPASRTGVMPSPNSA
jgi:hypothetical protein